MDKLMDNSWFMKGIALVLAVLLYSAVPDNEKKSSDVDVPGEQNTETIQDVPVKSYYDTENLVISGVPNSVDVTLQGPMPQVQSAKALKNFEVYVDLEDIKLGNHTVPIKIKSISDKLKVQIDPAYANITVQEKVTKEFKVQAEYDTGLLEDGYIAEKPTVEPSTVLITGARDTVDRITYVKATIDYKNMISETITREAKVRVLDRELNKLDVVVEPDSVEVTIPVKSVKKKVPIRIIEKGSTTDGISIESIELDVNEATIIGPEELLKATDNVRVEVDVSQIEEDTTITLPVIISEGITKVDPKTVKVYVKVKRIEEKTISNVSINNEGLLEDFELEFLDPDGGKVDILISGPSDQLSAITADDFTVFVDVSNLKDGRHGVEIQVDGPTNVSWELNTTIAQISLEKKDN